MENTQEKVLNKEIVKEYVINNESMGEHLLKRSKKRSWWDKFCTRVSVLFTVYVSDKWYEFTYYLKNLRRFTPILREWRVWDYNYQVTLFAFGLEQLADYLEKHGNEVAESRNKKIAAIRELVTLLRTNYEDTVDDKYFNEDSFKSDYRVTEYKDGSIGFKDISPEEKQQVKEDRMKKYYEAREEAKTKYYNRIFRLIRGQKQSVINKLYEKELEKLSEKEKEDWNATMAIRDKISDGTGIEGWWD